MGAGKSLGLKELTIWSLRRVKQASISTQPDSPFLKEPSGRHHNSNIHDEDGE